MTPSFTANVYRVTYNLSGGAGVSPLYKDVTYDSTYGSLPTPTRSGYAFAGWYPAVTSDTAITDSTKVTITAPQTIYALWTPNSYTIAFEANGGTGSMDDLLMTYDTEVKLTANSFKRTGYTFSGWGTSSTGEAVYSDQQKVSNLTATHGSTINLYAVWTPNTYTITFDANGGTGSMDDLSMTYDKDKALTACAFARAHYDFLGWSTSKTASSATYSDCATVKNLTSTDKGSVTLYAVWKEHPKYSVSVTKGVGVESSSSSPANLSNIYSGSVVKVWGTAKPGYTLAASSEATAIEINPLVADTNVTLTATANTYTVTFNANGGDAPSSASKTVTYDSTYGADGALPTPTRTGYVFSGWYTAETGGSKIVENTKVTITDNQILYARWVVNTYTVNFLPNITGNDLLGSMDSLTIERGESFTLPENGFSCRGYTFEGWAESASGNVKYADMAEVSDLANAGSTKNLYARWREHTYTISFDKNSDLATGATESMTVRFTEDRTLSANRFTRPGYVFNGWMRDKEGIERDYRNQASVNRLTAEDGATVTLYAFWVKAPYQIRFYGNGNTGGATPPNQDMTYDTAESLTPNNFTKTGYSFVGWATSATGPKVYEDRETVWNLTDQPNTTVNLYAVWSPNAYTIIFDPNNGTGSMTSLSMTYGTEKTLPTSTFMRDHYYFLGWSTSQTASSATYADGATVKNLTSTVDGSVTLYAVWKEHPKYSVWVTKGTGVDSYSSDPEVLTNIYSNSVVKVWGTAKSGYTLAASSEATAIVIDSLVSSTNVTLTATANTYTVTFNANGGALPNGASQTLEVTYDSPYGALPDPARTGYTFAGWYLGSDRVYAEWTNVTTADNHTLVASWTPNKYPLSTRIKDGEGSISVSPYQTRYDYGSSVTLTAKPDVGYSFAYWEDDRDADAERSITIRESDNSYSAAFTANVYRVTFDINAPKSGFVATPSFSSRGYTYGGTYDELPTISHYAYEFRGWYTMTSGGTKITNDSSFWATNDDTILYAHWEMLPRYEVKFENGIGVDAIYYKRDVEDRDYSPYSSPASVISNLTVSAYATALPGYAADNSSDNPFTSIPIEGASSFTLTATPNKYKVYFSCEGATNPPEPKSVTYQEPYGALPTPTKSDGRVVGWYLDSDLTTKITAESIFNKTGDVTLYAKWYEYDVSLTEAADCNEGMTLKRYLTNVFKVEDVTGTVGGTAVVARDENLQNVPGHILLADIQGSGTLSFDWKLQNHAVVEEIEAEAVLFINDEIKASVYNPYDLREDEYPEAKFVHVELPLEDVTSAQWVFRVKSSNGFPVPASFYLDNVKWIPNELEKWAALLGCEATEKDVAAAKLAVAAELTLSITIDSDGKPNVSMPNLDTTKPYASKVKIECCEDLANPDWNEHDPDPAQHSACRFYRGTLNL